MTGSAAPGGKNERETIVSAVADLAAAVHLLTCHLCEDDQAPAVGSVVDAVSNRMQRRAAGRGGEPDDQDMASEVEELSRLRAEVAQLREALVSRSVIERAKGMIMAQAGCAEDDAFHLLVEVSRRQRRKLREVASQIAARNHFVAVDLPLAHGAAKIASRHDPADSG